MYAFTHHSATSIADAVKSVGEGKYLAGGHTLVPTMKQRLAMPGNIVDLNKVAELKGVSDNGGVLTVKAMTRHYEVENSPVVQKAIPGLAKLAGGIGDPQVRHRGTMGGSVANNDPAADYPAAVLALNATIVTDRRRIAADDYFKGLFTTALEDSELITAIEFPHADSFSYAKFRNPASLYAMVGVAIAKKGGAVRVAVTGAGSDGVFRWKEAEDKLAANFTAAALDGLAVSPSRVNGDLHGSAEYRAHLIGVMAKRAMGA
ncbi:MAG: xanthine dehydrogenase family protein subunit M [Hyphomicrobiales bacterium]|nr:xanthine dehydrogenase family protein subunit M [Hyphomicrobiales bacterium]